MKKGFRVFSTLLLLCGFLFTGCGNATNSTASEKKSDDTIEIGMSFDSFVIERWQRDRDVFVSTAQGLGATVNVQNANGDTNKQIEQIKYFIEKKVDCIVIIPINAEELVGVVKEAKDAGIKVIAYDRLINDVNVDLYISFDNEKVGTMMGDAIASTGAKKVVMICGPLADNNVPMVMKGFKDESDKAGMEIIDIFHCDGWKAEYGASYVYDNINTIGEADAIMCGNDDVATNVIRALAVTQMAGQIPVVGQDADLPACQHIVEGTQIMTVYKPVEKLASEAARMAYLLATGEKIEVTDSISDGTYIVPYVAVEPTAVTKSNIDEVIIESGFHSKEDVYLNVRETEEITEE